MTTATSANQANQASRPRPTLPPERTDDTAATKSGATNVVAASALLTTFAAAIAGRVIVAGAAGRDSAKAGLLFGGVLLVAAAVAGLSNRIDVRAVLTGVVGVAVLCAPVIVVRAMSGNATHRPAGNYAAWAFVVCVVALAEEAFLRGALYQRLEAVGGPSLAIVGGAICFAALHVPLYGWRAAAFDLAVGLWLGALRHLSGSWVAPGIAHAGADLAAWWLR
jgi:membrane protease YdiL (CAAX protease family)